MKVKLYSAETGKLIEKVKLDKETSKIVKWLAKETGMTPGKVIEEALTRAAEVWKDE